MIRRPIALILAVLLACLTGLVSLQVWRAYTSPNWPTTEGVVVAFYETPNYRYHVGSGTYTGSYVSCNEIFDHLRSAPNSEKYSIRYPLEAKVVVHYCRSDPAIAVLETKFDSSGLFLVAVPFIFACLFAAAAVLPRFPFAR